MALKVFCKFCLQVLKVTCLDPDREIQLPVRPKPFVHYLTNEEVQRLRDSIETHKFAGLRMRTLIEVLLTTGPGRKKPKSKLPVSMKAVNMVWPSSMSTAGNPFTRFNSRILAPFARGSLLFSMRTRLLDYVWARLPNDTFTFPNTIFSIGIGPASAGTIYVACGASADGTVGASGSTSSSTRR
jgi:hypothetical protein